MSSKRHHSSSSSRRNGSSSRRSTNHSDSDSYDDDDRRDDSPYYKYKKLYADAKHDLKRKRRQVDELESKLHGESSETKKAKQDTQDLWKIYYTLQQELQESYERNGKLGTEKTLVEAEVTALKKELESLKKGGESDPDKLKAALCEMQKQKLQMQNGYNQIVLENKKLKEKEGLYEPRLRELDGLKQKLNTAVNEAKQLSAELMAAKQDFASIGFCKEEVEKYQSWNALLMMESHQKGQRLYHLDSIHRKNEELVKQVRDLKEKLADVERLRFTMVQNHDDEKFRQIREKLALLAKDAAELKMEVSWSGNGVEGDLDKFRQCLLDASQQINSQLNKIVTTSSVSTSSVSTETVTEGT